MSRRLMATAMLAGLALAPFSAASADPFLSACDSDDYRLAYVEVAGTEVAEVCTSINPTPSICLPCLFHK